MGVLLIAVTAKAGVRITRVVECGEKCRRCRFSHGIRTPRVRVCVRLAGLYILAACSFGLKRKSQDRVATAVLDQIARLAKQPPYTARYETGHMRVRSTGMPTDHMFTCARKRE